MEALDKLESHLLCLATSSVHPPLDRKMQTMNHFLSVIASGRFLIVFEYFLKCPPDP